MTFTIAAPEKFVFTISAPDFDQVCQATCQENVRVLVRSKDSDEVLDLGSADTELLRSGIGATLESYGVEVVRVVLTHVTPPMEFIASRESRRHAASGVRRSPGARTPRHDPAGRGAGAPRAGPAPPVGSRGAGADADLGAARGDRARGSERGRP